MNKKVWIFQAKKDVRRKGPEKASWFVGWYDLAGKRHSESCGPGARGRNKAVKRQRRIQSELDTGVHQPRSRKSWIEFQSEFEEIVLAGLAPDTRSQAKVSLAHFQRIVKPGKMDSITTQCMDSFLAKRRLDPGKKPNSKVSPATINKDLRHIKAALNVACRWKYLLEVPRIPMVREPDHIPRFVTEDHFQMIYLKGCPSAKMPRSCDSPANWWQALIVTAYMTGLRISELLSLRLEDCDLKAGWFITRADDNKGKRDEKLPLHPVVVAHLERIAAPDGNSPLVFLWDHDERTLWEEFGRIQRQAGIRLVCHQNHEHTAACHVYGFHDFRRAFATVNAPRVKPEALQRLMRHKSYQTTRRYYINVENQLTDAVRGMPVPDALNHVNHPPRADDRSSP